MDKASSTRVDERETDPIDASFGSWRRSEPPDELHRGMRAAFEEAIHRRATGGKLYCPNTRHYPMDDVLVERAWPS